MISFQIPRTFCDLTYFGKRRIFADQDFISLKGYRGVAFTAGVISGKARMNKNEGNAAFDMHSSDERVNDRQAIFEIDVRQWVSAAGVDNAGTHVSEPVEITCYSRDEARTITYGSRAQLLKYSEPKLPANLGENFDTYIPKADEAADVGSILRALLKASFDIPGQVDIVTYRNNLNKIGTTPYENRDGWEFDCALIGKSVFLDIPKMNDSCDPSQQLFSYFGYRFESLCTGVADEPVNANSEFCSVLRLRIANHRILMAAEIDCEMQSGDTRGNPLRKYVELKTMRVIDNDRALFNMYRHRFLKYWLQSYLAGVRNIALGLRSDSGELLQVKWKRTGDLPREAQQHFMGTNFRKGWIPFVCINFLDYVLASVRRVCFDRPGSTIRIRLDPITKRIQFFVVSGPDQMLAPRIRAVLQEFEQ